MAEAFQTKSPASVEGATAGQVLNGLEQLEDTTMQAAVEAEMAFNSISPNHALALAYAEYVPVFCASPYPQKDDPDSPRKTPMFVRSWKAEATQDSEIITRWFRQEPRALVAIPCEAAGLLVVDPDVRPPRGDKPAVDGLTPFLELLAENGGAPEGTVVAKTNGGGRHYIYKQLENPLGNSSGSLPDNCDVRGCGGFFIAPGNKWRGGGWRELPDSPKLLDALRDGTLPEPIEWLVELIRGNRQGDKDAAELPLSERAKAIAPACDGSHADADERGYIEAALDWIPSDSRDVWLKVGGALHDSGEPWSRSVWDDWSKRSSKFNATDQEKNWASFSRPTEKKASKGSIIFMAKERGFTGKKFDYGPTPDPAYLKMAQDFIEKQKASSKLTAVDTGDSDGAGETGGGPKSDCAGLKFYFDGEDATTPPPSLVKGLLPYEGIAMIGGQSGAGKTFIAVNLAVMLSSGKPFFGRKVAERVGVVIVAAEGAATIASRVHAAREDSDPDCELLPISWIKEVPDLRQPVSIAQLAGALKAHGALMQRKFGVRLGAVIIDTLGAAFSMEDENSNAEANRILRALHWLSKETDALILPIHHYGKAAETGLRGASAWRAGCDSVLSVLADRNEVTGEVGNRRLALAKSRVGEEGPIAGFTLSHVVQGDDGEGEEYGTCVVLPIEGELVTQKERRLNRDERAYLKALTVKMDKAERIFPFGNDGAEQQGVCREIVRAEFYASVSADGATAEKKANAKRQAFRRGERGLIDRQQINLREIGGREMVWIIAEDKSTQAVTPRQDDAP